MLAISFTFFVYAIVVVIGVGVLIVSAVKISDTLLTIRRWIATEISGVRIETFVGLIFACLAMTIADPKFVLFTLNILLFLAGVAVVLLAASIYYVVFFCLPKLVLFSEEGNYKLEDFVLVANLRRFLAWGLAAGTFSIFFSVLYNTYLFWAGFAVKSLSSASSSLLDKIANILFSWLTESASIEFLLIAALLCSFLIIASVYPRLKTTTEKLRLAVLINNYFITVLIFASVALLYNLLCGSGNGFVSEMYFVCDFYTTVLKLAVALTTILVLLASYDSLQNASRVRVEYPLLVVFSMIFLFLLISSYNFISLFVSTVGFSLNLYVLLLIDKDHVSREAGIKYFYLSTLSTGLMVFGIFLLYFIFGTTNFYEISSAMSANAISQLDSIATSRSIFFAVNFILIGLFFKLAAFPCQLWASEVYDGSPTPIMAFFILPVKIAVFGFFVRLLSHVWPAATVFSDIIAWKPLLFVAAGGSMLVGCFQALFERKVKRFLAYTSINQMGFLLMGLCGNTFNGFAASLMYLLIYIVMNVVFLSVFLFVYKRCTITTKDAQGQPRVVSWKTPITFLTDFRAFATTHRGYAYAIAIVVFSMAGLPFSAGFFGKFYLLSSTFATYPTLVVVGLATSFVSTFYYLRIVKVMFFEREKNNSSTQFSTFGRVRFPAVIDFVLFASISFILFFVFFNDISYTFIAYLSGVGSLPVASIHSRLTAVY